MMLQKKLKKKYESTELHDSNIADLTDFDKIFKLSQLVPQNLPILTKLITLYRLYYV
jgi:hypothetical protein